MPRVTATEPTDMPTGALVTVVVVVPVVTDADAVMYVAPSEELFAALIMIEATP